MSSHSSSKRTRLEQTVQARPSPSSWETRLGSDVLAYALGFVQIPTLVTLTRVSKDMRRSMVALVVGDWTRVHDGPHAELCKVLVADATAQRTWLSAANLRADAAPSQVRIAGLAAPTTLRPWLPGFSLLQRLVITVHEELTEVWRSLLSSPVLARSVLARSVRDLTVIDQVKDDLIHTRSWPADEDAWSGWTALESVRFERSDTLTERSCWIPAATAIKRILDPLIAARHPSVPLRRLQLEDYTYFRASAFDLASSSTTTTAGTTMWSLLEDLGLSVAAPWPDARWKTLVALCPRLTHLAMRTNEVVTDATLAIVGAGWPAMRSFRVYNRVMGPVDFARYKVTVAGGLRRLTSWPDLEVCWLDPRPPRPLLSDFVRDTGDLAPCLAAWPKLRELVTPTIIASFPPTLFAGGGGGGIVVVPHLESLVFAHHPGTACDIVWSSESWRTFLQEHPQLRHIPVAHIPLQMYDSMSADLGQFARELRCYNPAATCTSHVDALLERLHRLEDFVCRTDVVPVLAIRNALLADVRDFRSHGAQQPPPADWTARWLAAAGGSLPLDGMRPIRLLRTLQITVTSALHLSDGDLHAIALTCPALVTLELNLADDIKEVSASRTDVQPQALLFMLHHCPKLTTLHLDAAPLAGVRHVSVELALLTQLKRPVQCSVRFRLLAFGEDSGVESLAWLERHSVSTDVRTAPTAVFPRLCTLRFSTL